MAVAARTAVSRSVVRCLHGRGGGRLDRRRDNRVVGGMSSGLVCRPGGDAGQVDGAGHRGLGGGGLGRPGAGGDLFQPLARLPVSRSR
jgi:hypothetical protein